MARRLRARRRNPHPWGAAVVPLVLAALGSVSVLTAGNTVAGSRLVDVSVVIDANALKPAECAALDLTAVVTGSGSITGTASNELILGGSGIDTIAARSGADCVLAGGGGDIVSGEGGNDVLLGGPGADTLDGGLGTDACYGGTELDTFLSCETQVQ